MSVEGYVRGALIAFDPDGYRSNDAEKRRLIPFRFNPESLSRSLQIEQGQGGRGSNEPSGGGGSNGQGGGDASSGALKQTFSVLVRMDLVDRETSRSTGQADSETLKLGVLPEICALEELMHPAETAAQDNADGTEPVAPRRPRPTVWFSWGDRVFPVKINSMTINETLYNSSLYPTRAEVELSLEVANAADARDSDAFRDALAFGRRQRARLARRFYDAAAAQGTRIPDLTAGS